MDYGLSWIIVDKWGFLWIMYSHGLVDYCGTLWTIVDSQICTTRESHGLQYMHAKPLTTPKRYDASMARTVASIGHVLFCSYYGLLQIIDYHGLSWIIVDYNGLWTMLNHHGLAWIMDYRLSWTVADYQ